MHKSSYHNSDKTVFIENQRFSSWLIGGVIFLIMLINIVIVYATASGLHDDNAQFEPLVMTAPIILVLAIFLLFELRIRVTTDEISFGFWFWRKRRIALLNIAKAEAITYSPIRDFGGWGYRIGSNGTMYNAKGNKAVKMFLKDETVIFIGSQKPEQLLRAILTGR